MLFCSLLFYIILYHITVISLPVPWKLGLSLPEDHPKQTLNPKTLTLNLSPLSPTP